MATSLKRIISNKSLIKWLSLLAGIALFFLFFYFSGLENFSRLNQVKLFPLLFVFILTYGITSCISYRWGTLVNVIGGKQVAKWYQYYHYFVAGRVLGFVLPKDLTDFFGRAGSLNRLHGMSLKGSALSVLLDRLFDLLTALIFFGATLPYWLGFVDMGLGIALMIGIAIITYCSLLFYYGFFSRVLSTVILFGKKVIKYFPVLKNITLNQDDLNFLDKRTMFIALTLSILKFWLTALRFALIATALQISIPSPLFFLGTPLGQLAYVFAFTPGGLGIFEAGWFGILYKGGISFELASFFVVGQRILIVTCVLFIFLISQFHYIFNRQKKS